MTVWRFHDYVHSGICLQDGMYVDGIFYGFMKQMEWEDYLISDLEKPLLYRLPKTTVGELARQIMKKGHFAGVRLVGNPEDEVSTVFLAEHITGREERDKTLIQKIDEEQIDVVIPLELVDYTVTEYIRDASCIGARKAILNFGHFNTEEVGMAYLESYFVSLLDGKVKIIFCPSADMFQYFI